MFVSLLEMELSYELAGKKLGEIAKKNSNELF